MRLRSTSIVLLFAIGSLVLAPAMVCSMQLGCPVGQGMDKQDCCTPADVPNGWNRVPCPPRQLDAVYLQAEKVSIQTVQIAVATPDAVPARAATFRSALALSASPIQVPRFLLACNLRL